jgi:hypothetical protein
MCKLTKWAFQRDSCAWLPVEDLYRPTRSALLHIAIVILLAHLHVEVASPSTEASHPKLPFRTRIPATRHKNSLRARKYQSD